MSLSKIGLTDEEIHRIKYLKGTGPDGAIFMGGANGWRDTAIARAQLKKVVEWGNGWCEHTPGTWGESNTRRRECSQCWQSLLDEVKEA